MRDTSHRSLVKNCRGECLAAARNPSFGLIVFSVLLLYNGASEHGVRAEAGEPAKARAVLHGRTIEIRPEGASFEISQDWLDWQAEFHNSIHLSPAELAKVRVGAGEWDMEYAEIVNALLPFGSCLAHAGGEGWGKSAVSYGDVQMRAYIVEMSPEQIIKRMAKEGPSQAFRYSKKVSLSRSEFKKWQRVTLSYDLWYSDYGGTANVDVFPTILDLFGFEPETEIHGRSVLPLIRGETQATRPWSLYGYFGRYVSITDGKYTYLRAPGKHDAELNIYSLRWEFGKSVMPAIEAAMRNRELQLGDFMKQVDMPVGRMPVPVSEFAEEFETENGLYNLDDDAAQENNLAGTRKEQEYEGLLKTALEKVDCPPEQFRRLGL